MSDSIIKASASENNGLFSDYVRQYFDVKKRAFLRNYMRDFWGLNANFLFVNHTRNTSCEIRNFPLKLCAFFHFNV